MGQESMGRWERFGKGESTLQSPPRWEAEFHPFGKASTAGVWLGNVKKSGEKRNFPHRDGS